MAKQQAELNAREKALADREAAAAASPTPVVEETTAPPAEEVVPEQTDSDAPAEPQSTAAYGMFYEKLGPQGEWLETSQYGYVFQPREAETSHDWRPYTEGHWVYSDAGWTWVSDEPFGWATYHYGRWVRLRRVGWVWVPGKEWAPAWVSWRSSKDYVGWAPLPPEARFDRRSGIQNWADSYYDIGPDQYSFVPANEFGAEHLRRAVVPAERNINIVIETTNVTRITFSNTTIVNEGPSYDELRSRSQRPIERYRLRRERNFEGPPRVQGTELAISVPVLSEVRNVFRPRRVKERVTDVNVDNGWTSVSDRSAAERARTKIKAEATPPPNAPPKRFVPPAETAPSAAASTTPAATAAASATVAPARSPTPAPAATASPATSPSPRAHRSPSVAPTMSPSPAASPTAAETRAASPTPAVSMTPRVRPSPSIPVRVSPTPLPKASVPIAPRRTAPPVTNTPVPANTPSAVTEPSAKSLPTFTPARRPPISPRPTLPTPSVAPETSETARPSMPKDVPRHTPAIRMTPPPVATTPAPVQTPAAAQSPALDERPKNRKPRPAPPTESGTPTPAPSTPPN
jgi:hypothetical protein